MFLVVRLSFLLEKQLLMKLSFDKQQIYANFFVGIDASQLYTYLMSQPLPNGLCTRWDVDSETSRLTPRHDETRSWGNTVMSYFQRRKPGQAVKLKASRQQADRRKMTAAVVMHFVHIATLSLKLWFAFTILSLSISASIAHWRGYPTP